MKLSDEVIFVQTNASSAERASKELKRWAEAAAAAALEAEEADAAQSHREQDLAIRYDVAPCYATPYFWCYLPCSMVTSERAAQDLAKAIEASRRLGVDIGAAEEAVRVAEAVAQAMLYF